MNLFSCENEFVFIFAKMTIFGQNESVFITNSHSCHKKSITNVHFSCLSIILELLEYCEISWKWNYILSIEHLNKIIVIWKFLSFFNFTDGMLHFEFIKVKSAWSKEFQTEVCR